MRRIALLAVLAALIVVGAERLARVCALRARPRAVSRVSGCGAVRRGALWRRPAHDRRPPRAGGRGTRRADLQSGPLAHRGRAKAAGRRVPVRQSAGGGGRDSENSARRRVPRHADVPRGADAGRDGRRLRARGVRQRRLVPRGRPRPVRALHHQGDRPGRRRSRGLPVPRYVRASPACRRAPRRPGDGGSLPPGADGRADDDVRGARPQRTAAGDAGIAGGEGDRQGGGALSSGGRVREPPADRHAPAVRSHGHLRAAARGEVERQSAAR